MDALLSQVTRFANTVDQAGRGKLLDALRDLQYSLESSEDTLQRLLFVNLQISGVRIGVDLKLFDILSESDSPLSVELLTRKTDADPVLLGRLLRYMSSHGLIKETRKNHFAATNITKTLAVPGNQAGIRHYFDTVGPMYQELPNFLASTKYQNITDNTKTVLQPAWKTDLPAFLWFQHNPQRFEWFNQYMAVQRVGSPTWLSVYPVKEQTVGWSPDEPVFVDVGGGIGHQCQALKSTYPHLQGRVILQDLPHAIDYAIPTPGVENVVHDFFQPQPVKGAKFYYMRNILHDYPDEKCQLILRNLIAAMGRESLILIDDMVVSDTNPRWQATQLDLTMMTALASMERTQSQWYTLLESVGLKIVNIYTYLISTQDSIIATVLE